MKGFLDGMSHTIPNLRKSSRPYRDMLQIG